MDISWHIRDIHLLKGISPDELEKIFDQFKDIVILLVNKVLIPILPFFIAANFAVLSYEGSIEKQLPVFLKVILIVIVGHFIWMILMYTIAGFYHKTNPFKLLKYYPPVCLFNGSWNNVFGGVFGSCGKSGE